MIVRLTQIDGKLPNLALMKLSAHHRARGDKVHFSRSPVRGMFEPDYDIVYGSAIFDYSARRVERLLCEFPGAVVGGTWNQEALRATGRWAISSATCWPLLIETSPSRITAAAGAPGSRGPGYLSAPSLTAVAPA